MAPNYLASTVAAATYSIVPLPAVQSLSPPFTNVSAGAITLTVSGSGFDPNATVYLGADPLATKFVSSTSLSAQVPASDLARSGIATVTVHTTAAGGGSSNAFPLEIDTSAGSASQPVFKAAAATVAAGATATYPVTLPASASNVTVTCLNLPAGTTCSYLSSTLTIATSSTTPSGTYQIVAVFTETFPGVATAWLFFMPTLIFFAGFGKRGRTRRIALVLIVIGASAVVGTTAGCGGGKTSPVISPQAHQVSSSGLVTLNLQ